MSTLERWFGGSPVVILIKLIVVSLLVGVVLAYLGLTPLGLVRSLVRSVEAMFGVGVDALADGGRYILTGAVVVVPIFILMRVFGRR